MKVAADNKKRRKIKQEAKKLIRRIKASPTSQNVQRYNSFVLGIHHYFKRATHVNLVFTRLAYDLKSFLYNRLRPIGRYDHPNNPPPTYKKFFSLKSKTFKVAKTYLYPLGDVSTVNAMNFSPELSPYTLEGRKRLYKRLRPDIQYEVGQLMKSNLPNRTIEYLDNRISRYSMKMGKCEITGWHLTASDVHCHHFKPVCLGGNNTFQNLRVLHQDIHRLIHLSDISKIRILNSKLNINQTILVKINQYRKVCGQEAIVQN